ncbi:uncharacterized protein LOC135839211 [Planococcus citri]|uniref:uncharacterized protein LOC135839211 n=1 Tax=Planococcus citri TaxID=170843 RepID=UPI0031F9EA3F
MKSLSVVLVLTISLACARATPGFADTKEGMQECNPSNTFQRNPHLKILDLITTGANVQLKHAEKCFLLCLLQRSNQFDKNGYLRNGAAYVKELLDLYKEIAKYSDILMAQIFHIARLARSFNDKCETAFVMYHHISMAILALRTARGIEDITHTKHKIVNIVESTQIADQQTTQQLEQYFEFFDTLINDEATWENKTNNTSTMPFCQLQKSMKTTRPTTFSISHKPSTIRCSPN